MLGRTHALTGWCAGLVLAPTAGLTSVPEVVVFAATTAGYALLPDLDHPGARASRLLGPVTGVLSRVLRAASGGVYRVTKGPADEQCTGKHRHLSHTVLFAALMGVAAGVGGDTGGAPVVAGIVLLGLLLAERALGDWVALAATGGMIAFVASEGWGMLDTAAAPIGVAVAAGCVTHCLGDMLTESGCPLLWPVPIAGETWYELRPPGFLRFRTGKVTEQAVVFPAFAVLGIALLPGVGSALW